MKAVAIDQREYADQRFAGHGLQQRKVLMTTMCSTAVLRSLSEIEVLFIWRSASHLFLARTTFTTRA